jgi:hypothetical protein
MVTLTDCWGLSVNQHDGKRVLKAAVLREPQICMGFNTRNPTRLGEGRVTIVQ